MDWIANPGIWIALLTLTLLEIVLGIDNLIFMLMFVNVIGTFVEQHSTIKMLALSFLILIGTMLVAEGFHQHINKGYTYFAMAFAAGVECLNIRMHKMTVRVALHQPYR